jgi:hypothetical protein
LKLNYKYLTTMKTVSIISIVYGIFGFIWASLILVAIGIQKTLIENVPVPEEALKYVDITAIMETLHSIFSLLVPFVFLIGIIYIISGILGLNEKPQSYTFGMLAAVFNVIWYITLIITIQVELLPLIKLDSIIPANIFKMIFVLGSIVDAIFYCAYPVFLIIFLSQKKGKI